jgi:hypothetical protein
MLRPETVQSQPGYPGGMIVAGLLLARITQHLFAQRPRGLRAAVVEPGRLADDDGPGAREEDALTMERRAAAAVACARAERTSSAAGESAHAAAMNSSLTWMHKPHFLLVAPFPGVFIRRSAAYWVLLHLMRDVIMLFESAAANGDVAFWSSSFEILRYRGGVVTGCFAATTSTSAPQVNG